MFEHFLRTIRSSISRLQLFLPRSRRYILIATGQAPKTEFFPPSPLSKGAFQLQIS